MIPFHWSFYWLSAKTRTIFELIMKLGKNNIWIWLCLKLWIPKMLTSYVLLWLYFRCFLVTQAITHSNLSYGPQLILWKWPDDEDWVVLSCLCFLLWEDLDHYLWKHPANGASLDEAPHEAAYINNYGNDGLCLQKELTDCKKKLSHLFLLQNLSKLQVGSQHNILCNSKEKQCRSAYYTIKTVKFTHTHKHKHT